jgi:ribosomal protein S27AE
MSMRIDKRVKAKKVLRQPSAARLARAEAEDRMDAEWSKQWLRVLNKFAKERGLPWFEAFLAVDRPPLPPRPAGFERRRDYCNRCGQRTSMSDEFDALYCGRCNRWIDSKCSDPHCSYCSKRPVRPLP